MPLELNDYNLILMELNKAVKMHNFYPQGHPNLENALQNCHNLMLEKMGEGEELKFTLSKKGFFSDKNPIAPENEDLAGLAKKLFYRRVKEFTITHDITAEELAHFLEIVQIEPDEIAAKGGVESILASKSVEGVLLNEMRYEDLKRLKAQLEEKEAEKEEEKELSVETTQPEAEEGEEEAEAEVELSEPEAEEEPVDEQLQELLEKIENEGDFLRYNDLSVRVNEKVESLIKEKSLAETFPALLLFFNHSESATGRDPDICTIARERLDQFLVNKEVLRYLIDRAGRKEEAHRAAIQQMIVRRGDDAIELLLIVLIDAKEASTRRNLFNTAVLFGNPILPHIERELKSETWYAVRQMVALLGEIGDPITLDMLQQTYLHEDLRVKREVLKSMARIASERSTQFLIEALDESDKALVNQAITSLGMLRDPAAIEQLGKIALSWDSFAESQEAKREAIKALGIIGDQRAVVHLSKILLKKRWFSKGTNEDFRALAANALGMVGGEDAFKAIEKVLAGSEGDLFNTCKRILDGREKKA
ncbi:MAG: HEAT repeat domain-containing protein [Proteobacteria bacterium]|nr:HEAT repeat domain-containing protein [Pseudomonadota bacterium]